MSSAIRTLSFNTLIDLFNSGGDYGKPFQEDGKWFQYRLYLKPNSTTKEIDLGELIEVTEDSLKFNNGRVVFCFDGAGFIGLGKLEGPYVTDKEQYRLDSSLAEQAPVFIEKKERLPISSLGGGKSKKNRRRRRCKGKRTRRQRSR